MKTQAEWRQQKILITGGKGFLGSKLIKKLIKKGIPNKNIITFSSSEHDLRKNSQCIKVVKNIDVVIHLAAKVGGIGYNKENPATLFYDNTIMSIQLMEAARLAGVKKFVTIGTICSYPNLTPVPFREDDLLKIAIKKFKESKRNSLATFSVSEKKLGKIENNFFIAIDLRFVFNLKILKIYKKKLLWISLLICLFLPFYILITP